MSSRRTTVVTRVRPSRGWLSIDGPKATRGVAIAFWAARRGTVVFLVDELWPDCRFAGRFVVRTRPGRNVIRFNGRIRGRKLDPGTYRLTAHSPGADVTRLVGVTVVVLARPARPAVVEKALARNTCSEGTLPSTTEFASFGGGKDGPGGVAGVKAGQGARRTHDDAPGGPLSAVRGPVAGALEAMDDAANAASPALFALAALAVLLLAVAALPQPVRTSRAGAAVVHHRATIALAGVGVLIGAVVAFTML